MRKPRLYIGLLDLRHRDDGLTVGTPVAQAQVAAILFCLRWRLLLKLLAYTLSAVLTG
jgi:hypothetical protein